MAASVQTTHAGSMGSAVAEYCIADLGTTWVDFGGWEIGITYDSWDRDTGQRKTITGDEAIMGRGKLNLTGLTINAVYSDGDTTDFIDVVWTDFVTADGGQFMIRDCPQGTASGKMTIETNTDAIIDSLTFPGRSSDDATPFMFSCHIKTSGFDMAAHT